MVWIGCLCLLIGANAVRAQSFVLTLTNTPDPILLGRNITYSLSVSNATGQNLNPGFITSAYGKNAEFVLATNLFGITNTPGLVIFEIPSDAFPANGVIDVFLELRGTNVGRLTNTFTVEIVDQGQTFPASTSVVSTIILPAVDLGISIAGPADGVFPGDVFSYRLLASNAGPDEAAGVVVSNALPDHVSLLGLSPSESVELVDGYVLFSPGTLTNRESADAIVSVLATNAASSNRITAVITAPNVSDTNPANNSFSTNVPILTPDSNQIVVVDLSTQLLNQQTGWMEQRVLLENVGTTAVDSVRLLVGGLTNALINVTGTNGTTPYVAHGAGLGAGEQLAILLEYFNPSRMAGADPLLTAYGTPPLDLTPQDGVGIPVDRIVRVTSSTLNDGRILLEWPVTSDGPFQVIYDGEAEFGGAKGSLPLVQAPAGANRVQWLDYGPPRTQSAPSNTATRFYRIIELP